MMAKLHHVSLGGRLSTDIGTYWNEIYINQYVESVKTNDGGIKQLKIAKSKLKPWSKWTKLQWRNSWIGKSANSKCINKLVQDMTNVYTGYIYNDWVNSINGLHMTNKLTKSTNEYINNSIHFLNLSDRYNQPLRPEDKYFHPFFCCLQHYVPNAQS